MATQPVDPHKLYRPNALIAEGHTPFKSRKAVIGWMMRHGAKHAGSRVVYMTGEQVIAALASGG
jgi:hypothetical protein